MWLAARDFTNGKKNDARLQRRTSFPEAPMVAVKRKMIRPDALFLPGRAKV